MVFSLPPLKSRSTHRIFLIPVSSSAAVVDSPPGPAPTTIASYESVMMVDDQLVEINRNARH
jgi:hypothetical protein